MKEKPEASAETDEFVSGRVIYRSLSIAPVYIYLGLYRSYRLDSSSFAAHAMKKRQRADFMNLFFSAPPSRSPLVCVIAPISHLNAWKTC